MPKEISSHNQAIDKSSGEVPPDPPGALSWPIGGALIATAGMSPFSWKIALSTFFAVVIVSISIRTYQVRKWRRDRALQLNRDGTNET